MLVDWHLAPPVLSSKPAAYLRSGLVCPRVFPLNLLLPGSRIILKAKNNTDVTLLGSVRWATREEWTLAARPGASTDLPPRCPGFLRPPPLVRAGGMGEEVLLGMTATASAQTAEKSTY